MSLLQEKSYHFGQIILHWLIALLVFYQFISGNTFSVKKLNECKTIPVVYHDDCSVIFNHYWIGTLILILMIIRLVMRLYFGAPSASNKLPNYIKIIGKLSHLILYLLLISLPIIGLLGWYFDSSIMFPVHIGLSKILLFLILLHICAVGFHEGILGSKLLYRMVSFNTKNEK